jgi:hypothetical protein
VLLELAPILVDPEKLPVVPLLLVLGMYEFVEIGKGAAAIAVTPPAEAIATGRDNVARTFPCEFLKFKLSPAKA